MIASLKFARLVDIKTALILTDNYHHVHPLRIPDNALMVTIPTTPSFIQPETLR
jgi:hypothetical protein